MPISVPGAAAALGDVRDWAADQAERRPVAAAAACGVACSLAIATVVRRLFFVRGRGRRLRATSLGISTLLANNGYGVSADFHPIITVQLQLTPPQTTARGSSGAASTTAADPLPCLLRFLEELTQHHRFRAVPTPDGAPGTPLVWVTQPVRLLEHVVRHRVASAAEERGVVERVVNAPLANPRRPLWELHLIDRAYDAAATTTGATKAATPSPLPLKALLRIHHVIGDGISLADACLAGVFGADGKPLSPASVFAPRGGPGSPTSPPKPSGSSGVNGKRGPVPPPARRTLLRKALAPVSFAVEFVRATLSTTWPCDGPSALHLPTRAVFPPHSPQRPVFFPSHSLDLVKRIRFAADPTGGVTINDVEFALLAGALRRFLAAERAAAEAAGAPPPPMPRQVRSQTPVAFPEQAHPAATRHHTLLRNHFLLTQSRLPVTATTALRRLAEAAATWREIKVGWQVPATYTVFRLVSLLPLWFRQEVAAKLQRRASVIFSNVPGPQQPCFLPTPPAVVAPPPATAQDGRATATAAAAGEAAAAEEGWRVRGCHIFCPGINPYLGLFSLDGNVHLCGSFYVDGPGSEPAMGGREGKAARLDALPAHWAAELRELCASLDIPAADVDAAL